jgi:hypothetical protein
MEPSSILCVTLCNVLSTMLEAVVRADRDTIALALEPASYTLYTIVVPDENQDDRPDRQREHRHSLNQSVHSSLPPCCRRECGRRFRYIFGCFIFEVFKPSQLHVTRRTQPTTMPSRFVVMIVTQTVEELLANLAQS